MRKILGLSIAALIVITLVVGATWAYFSDTAATTGNTLIAGTLDVGLSNTDTLASGSTSATWQAADWAPGGTKDGTLYVSNNGTINVTTLTVAFDYLTVDTSARPTTISGSPWTTDPTDLFDKMVYVSAATLNSVNVPALVGQSLADLKAAGDISLPGALNAGATLPLYLEFTFDTTATNGCQGNSVDVTVSVTGTQN